MPHILRSPADLTPDEVRHFYDGFDAPICDLDCGRLCAPHNPGGKPFCCDLCHAVPAAYASEWACLRSSTDLWRPWHGDECGPLAHLEPERLRLLAETPASMTLLACLGPERCQRSFRTLSCRQFPFYPYVSSDYRFLGLACEWEFEHTCWVLHNLGRVSAAYRQQFIHTFDRLLALFQDVFEDYACHSENTRRRFAARGRRFPLLHRNGRDYLVSPLSERLRVYTPGGCATPITDGRSAHG